MSDSLLYNNINVFDCSWGCEWRLEVSEEREVRTWVSVGFGSVQAALRLLPLKVSSSCNEGLW
uniref:Uncharacterized protein n=1 Tax=Anguilla anguilla TaxID=7936 RepID=A0A0E9R6S3_ANGAN